MKSRKIFPIDIAIGSLPSRERGLKLYPSHPWTAEEDVAPFAGAWIEIKASGLPADYRLVAPFAGAWIEIPLNFPRGRGCRVAPFAGAWIEIVTIAFASSFVMVAPFAGAWIEISGVKLQYLRKKSSLPSRERGLKSQMRVLEREETMSLPSRERGLK